ncbi:hypothetical protein [Clostridium frigidicarnis]|uniref:O-antigen ligase like membrane protein n=1 Tax=Clostridium frigidicarnis TaxID=84698 RepID=A0A1I0VWM9_9CLOT|nr:hypothetical protein [Clostridium frigidicarnis]SFA80845.1 hypothetical protein SAMN04488528_100392 [Clostridium frigidicarnis]
MKEAMRKFFSGVEFIKSDLLMFLPFSLLIVITGKENLIYPWFILMLIKEGYMIVKRGKVFEESLLSLTLYTYILADNYSSMVMTLILTVYILSQIIRGKRKINLSNKTKYIIMGIFIYIVVNIILNRVPMANILLYIFYNATFVCIMFIILAYKPYEYGDTLEKVMNTMIMAQILHLIIYIPLNIDVIIIHRIGDWAIGTLGTSQGPMLFNLFIFSFIRFFMRFKENKKKNLLGWMAIVFIFGILTVSTALTMLFVVSMGIYSVLFTSNKLRIIIVSTLIGLSAVFYVTSPSWIQYQIKSTLFDSEFRNDEIKKFAYYEDTFLTVPKKDASFALKGAGLGCYSSRAALTSSGYYANWYNKLKLPIYNGQYMRKYIKPRLYSRYGLSVVDQPTSQYISIMGEFGYIGFIMFIALLVIFFIKSPNNRLTIIYLAMILTIDNWFEYPKLSILFFFTYYLIENYYEKHVKS